VLQCAVVRCSAVQCGAVRCSALQCCAVCCSVLQCSRLHGIQTKRASKESSSRYESNGAVCCTVFTKNTQVQIVASLAIASWTCGVSGFVLGGMRLCRLDLRVSEELEEQGATHCSTLQHTAAHCNTLQHTATHCSTLQHTAAHCNTLQHTLRLVCKRVLVI